MSNVARVAGQAANTLSKPLNVEDVFSTYLYEGTTGSQTHDNDIDLSTEGGLVWLKNRDASSSNRLIDSERGISKVIYSDATNAEATESNTITAFNTNGFSTGGYLGAYSFASWTFRKAPKFFDVVTYTGTGSAQTISHNLGTTPGFIVVKGYDTAGRSWACYHRSLGYTKRLLLNYTSAEATDSTYWNAEPTDAVFSVGTQQETNLSGTTYVAYLFAHNDGDASFGPDGDADIIKCGSYTGGTSGIEIDLGFEPQWLLIKSVDSANSWFCVDNMRGFDGDNGSNSASIVLRPNSSGSENTASFHIAQLLPNGFTINSVNYESNASGEDYIYIAIRRGPMGIPESASEVFSVTKGTNTTDWTYDAGFPVDTTLYKSVGGSGGYTFSRLTGSKYLRTDTTDAETSYTVGFDNMSFVDVSGSTNNGWAIWDWKRAPNYFDVVAYTGTGSSSLTVDHNLGVVPEMMWVKRRSGTSDWKVYHKDLTNLNSYLVINSTAAEVSNQTNVWPTAPTDTQLTIGNYTGDYTGGGDQGIAYLFASLDGVSKVGSYTGNGTDNHQIDCGFSNGARMVIIKAASTTGAWKILDTERGIVTGNDPFLHLDSTAVEYTSFDLVDPYSGGFAVNSNFSAWNQSGQTYIFYAIA